jgi:hypothetical protein
MARAQRLTAAGFAVAILIQASSVAAMCNPPPELTDASTSCPHRNAARGETLLELSLPSMRLMQRLAAEGNDDRLVAILLTLKEAMENRTYRRVAFIFDLNRMHGRTRNTDCNIYPYDESGAIIRTNIVARLGLYGEDCSGDAKGISILLHDYLDRADELVRQGVNPFRAEGPSGAELAQAAKGGPPRHSLLNLAFHGLDLSDYAGRQTLLARDLPTRASNRMIESERIDQVKEGQSGLARYVVQENDTWWNLSEQATGSPYNFSVLATINSVESGARRDHLAVGTTVAIPPRILGWEEFTITESVPATAAGRIFGNEGLADLVASVCQLPTLKSPRSTMCVLPVFRDTREAIEAYTVRSETGAGPE